MARVTIEGELSLEEAIKELERQVITEALESSNGNLTRAAQMLKLTRKGLRNKIKRLGIEKQFARLSARSLRRKGIRQKE